MTNTQPIVISIEGNIGSGKSTLVRELSQNTNFKKKYNIIRIIIIKKQMKRYK